MSKFFWTDAQQASERLNRSYVLFNDKIAYVAAVNPAARGEVPTAVLQFFPDGKTETISLDNEGFANFRKLPPLGWINSKRNKMGVYLHRKPVRTRTHGLSDASVNTGWIREGQKFGWTDTRYSTYVTDEGYAWSIAGKYPAMVDVLTHIKEQQSFALSPLYAIARDDGGVRWLYRETKRVGLFPGNDTIVLVDKFKFLREELHESPVITVSQIKDF